MERPRLTIALTPADWIMEIIGAAFLILMIGFPVYYYDILPETIPRHFNATGEPDGFSQKSVIWTLPIAGLVMYVGLVILNRFPHVFNYPSDITEENAYSQYQNATRLIRTLNMLIAASFFYIGYSSIQTSLGNQDGLGVFFLPVFLLCMFGTVGFYLYAAFRQKRTS